MVEADDGTIEEQEAAIARLHLPWAALIHSGNISVHAIVRVDAKDIDEFHERFDLLRVICADNGLNIDKSCRNPSRLSRLPGVTRETGKEQKLLATNEHPQPWGEWLAWAEAHRKDKPPEDAATDEPDFEDLFFCTGEYTPEPDPALIDGLLRVNQTMLVSGGSKAGKTWAMVNLMWMLASGGAWLGMECRKTRCVYINLEVSPVSFRRRCNDAMNLLHVNHEDAHNVRLLNARGYGYNAEALADKVIQFLGRDNDFGCVFVDPVYMLEDGDENSATDVKKLMAELARVSRTCSCAMVLVHHQTKGKPGQKSAIDRMAGSGVFARNPDAIVDISPLDVEDEEFKAQLEAQGYEAERMTFELRDFPRKSPLDLIFTGKRHIPDVSGRLSESEVSGSAKSGSKRGADRRSESAAEERERKAECIRECIESIHERGGKATRAEVLSAYNAKCGVYHLSAVKLDALKRWTANPNGALPFRMNPDTKELEEVD